MSRVVLVFSLYAFLGWCIESVFRSLKHRRSINSGFLYGPFIPVFGFGGAAIHYLIEPLTTFGYPAAILSLTVAVTVIEYLTGWIMESIFGLQLWDYSRERYNLHGRICLLFSLYWMLLTVVVGAVARPAIDAGLDRISPGTGNLVAGVLILYFVGDAAASGTMLLRFARKIRELAEASSETVHGVIENAVRLVRTRSRYLLHPVQKIHVLRPENLAGLLADRPEFGEILGDVLKRFLHHRNGPTQNARLDEQYREVSDLFNRIAGTSEYHALAEVGFGDTNLFVHNERIARIAYRVAVHLGWDAWAVFRASLLRFPAPGADSEVRRSWNEFTQRYFTEYWSEWQSEREFTGPERDIILHSTWPNSPSPPRTREGILVSVVALAVGVRERGRPQLLPELRSRKKPNGS